MDVTGMADAEKREKVIWGLMACNRQSYNGSDCQNCPYYEDEDTAELPFGICNIQDMFDDALALLREHEARVMTLEELQTIETPWNRNTPPYLFIEGRADTEARWMSWGFMHVFVRLPGTIGVQNYGSKWRVWNLQPSPEQMRDTKWDGDKDEKPI